MSAATMVALVAAAVAVLGWALRALVAAAREEARIRANWSAYLTGQDATEEIMHPRHRGEP